MSWGIPDVLVSSEVRQAFPFLLPFGIIGLWRWSLFFFRVVFWLCYRPIPPKKDETNGTSANRYKSSDVTIIVPTIDNGEEFLQAAKYWKKNAPREIIIVTSTKMENEMRRTCQSLQATSDDPMFRVLAVPKPNKRVQMVVGINAATTDIVALSDDDAIWTDRFLDWCLAPFDNDRMGGVGSKQVMVPMDKEKGVTFWEVIADFRLTMRMIETSASTFVDGGMSCISGRTALYRREILADPVFQEAFVNETWQGKYALHSGDDKFITRWLVKNEWNMQMQNHNDACLQTTFKNDMNFLKQVLRWTRNTWRSDFKSIFVDHKILWRHPYVAFNMFDKFINPIPMIWGLTIIIGNLITNGPGTTTYVVAPVVAWLLLSRTMRLIPHIIRKPQHIVYIPAMILFQYFFIFLKVYAVFTLHITDWGSRPTVAKESKGFWRTQASSSMPLASDTGSSNDSEDDDVEAATNETGSQSNREQETLEKGETKSPIPWYRRPAVCVGALVMVGVLLGIVHLVLVASNHRVTVWEMTVIAQDKSLSGDRATGCGLYDPVSDKTFLAYAGPNMNPTVMEFDHKLREFVHQGQVAQALPDRDYHDYPRMVMADDGHLLIVFTDSPNTLHMAKSILPHTSSGPWSQVQINDDKASYPCLIKSFNGDLYTFYRSRKDADYRPLHYVKSTDNGESWSNPRIAIDTGGLAVNQDPMNLNEIYAGCPRVEPASDDGSIPERFAMGWTIAGGGPGVIKHNNYHKDAFFTYFDPSTDTFSSVDGQDFGSMIDYQELWRARMFDTGPLDEDNKRIVDYYFAPSFVGGSNTNRETMVIFNSNRTLYAAKWTGNEWEHNVVFEGASISLFDLEKLGDEKFRLFHSQGIVLVLSTEDGGSNWSLDHKVSSPDGVGVVSKVIRIENGHPDMPIIAHENDWSLYFSDEPKDLNYVGNYKVWTLREFEYNPIRYPNGPSTSVKA